MGTGLSGLLLRDTEERVGKDLGEGAYGRIRRGCCRGREYQEDIRGTGSFYFCASAIRGGFTSAIRVPGYRFRGEDRGAGGESGI